jgi:hypothetical protein
MHAVVVTVSIDTSQLEAADDALRQQVIPRVSSAAGFHAGYWTRGADTSSGLSMVLFDTEENANAASEMVSSSPTPPGVTIRSVEVREVVASA